MRRLVGEPPESITLQLLKELEVRVFAADLILKAADVEAPFIAAFCEFGEESAHRVKARCFWLLGKAKLRQRAWDAAEEAFVYSAEVAPKGFEEAALASYGLAQLRLSRSDRETASLLFADAAKQFAEAGKPHSAAVCRAFQGFVAMETTEWLAARRHLQAAVKALGDGRKAPSLVVRILLALAILQAKAGDRDSARRTIKSAQSLYLHSTVPAESIYQTWLEAYAAAALGDLLRADEMLERVRVELAKADAGAETRQCKGAQAVVRMAMRALRQGDALLAPPTEGTPPVSGFADRTVTGKPEANAGSDASARLRRLLATVPLRLTEAAPWKTRRIVSTERLADRFLRGVVEDGTGAPGWEALPDGSGERA